MTVPPRSWTLPSPVVFTASDPHAADGKAGVGCVAYVYKEGAAPVWQVAQDQRVVGVIVQAEGQGQVEQALENAHRVPPDYPNKAVVTTLGIDPAPFVALGVTSCMVECYAQAGDEPYGDLHRMTWQAHHDGWPHVIPVVGVYDGIGLSHYFAVNGAASFKGGHWLGGPLGIYLAEGMTDTGSWPTLATL